MIIYANITTMCGGVATRQQNLSKVKTYNDHVHWFNIFLMSRN